MAIGITRDNVLLTFTIGGSYVFHSLLNFASLYQALQNVLGAPQGMSILTSKFLVVPPNARVLDIGCGTASFRQFLPKTIDYVGVDVNPRYIDQAKRRVTDGRFYVIGDRPECLPESGFEF